MSSVRHNWLIQFQCSYRLLMGVRRFKTDLEQEAQSEVSADLLADLDLLVVKIQPVFRSLGNCRLRSLAYLVVTWSERQSVGL